MLKVSTDALSAALYYQGEPHTRDSRCSDYRLICLEADLPPIILSFLVMAPEMPYPCRWFHLNLYLLFSIP